MLRFCVIGILDLENWNFSQSIYNIYPQSNLESLFKLDIEPIRF